VNQLLDPINYNGDVWATGPLKNFCDYAQIEFIVGFCLCLKKEVFETVGLLDEIYSPGYGEETDLQFKILESGHGIVQACDGTVEYAAKRASGNFPIYHAGNETFKDIPDDMNNGFFNRNSEVLRKKFGNGISLNKARSIDGWMNIFELRWLAKNAQKHKVVCEIGSWKGRSSRVIADHLPEDGVLYCIDTWNGSVNEGAGHAEAKNLNGDAVFMEFCSNNIDHIQSGKIIPIRMDSVNAAGTLKKSGIKFDMIFIDGEHTYEGCIRDIDAWKEFLADGGLFSGHDYLAWHGTTVAVQEKINNPKIDNQCMSTIWYCDKTDIKPERPVVYDAFIFNNELDILELRLATLYDVVDRFIIVEGDRTHGNKPKPLNFNDNLKRFEKFLNKITYIVVNDWPASDSWSMERWQRDAVMRGLTGCKDSDIVILGDCDEIARPEAIAQFDPEKVIMNFNQNFYYYNMTCQCETNWDWLKITTYKNLKEKTPCGIRYTLFTETEKDKTIYNGGWHFSFCTNKVESIIHKLECTAHQEYNTDEYKDPERILRLMSEGKDILGREEIKYKYVEVDETYPQYVLENKEKFKHLIRAAA
jgi:beta-1,4-mannosyl-glycoprotein beta-1,4-N-acetylglucosaminyltransferase